jgi:hypothetical protein
LAAHRLPVDVPPLQQIVFDYTAYNESAATIDSSYRKGQPAQTQLGIQGLIPGGPLLPGKLQQHACTHEHSLLSWRLGINPSDLCAPPLLQALSWASRA